ncbi:MAG: transglutaminase family protein [Gammaproteobacteria bacterium]|nr:transglutaminase family protein [Gammaproteobacteria bacterium]MYD76919.1 transglutaminase family protein [Gammaproteobacteria bacterium]MYJ52179.1 transglutaminase family protein [Gammaproteobacteria bacterium]
MSPSRHPRFVIDHRSVYTYSEPATGSVMTVHLQPLDEEGQRLLSFEIDVDPIATPVPCTDIFGNRYHLFNIHRSHLHTAIHSRSVVSTSDRAPLPERLEEDAWDRLDELRDGIRFWDCLAHGTFTRPSEALSGFAREHGLVRREDPLETLRTTCRTLHEQFTYTPNSTTVDSPIEQILTTRQGVCQDYTHVMITLARSWGIPSRYVSGYLFLEGVAGEQSPQGATHAWGEFWLPGIGWVGFDPTNNTVEDHRHIRLARGRDYADIAPTRGVLFGGGEAKLEISVSIDEDISGGALPGETRETHQQGQHPASFDLKRAGHFDPKRQSGGQQ